MIPSLPDKVKLKVAQVPVKVLCLGRMYQSELHAVLLSHIGRLVCLLAGETRSIAERFFPSLCLRVTILLTLYSMVWGWPVKEQG